MLMRVLPALRSRAINLLGQSVPQRKGVRLGNGVWLHSMPIVSLTQATEIRVRDKGVLCSERMSTALGLSRPVILRTLRPGARISIGEDVGLSGTAICAAVSVESGAGCLMGAEVQIVDTDFHPLAPEGRRHCGAAARIAATPVRQQSCPGCGGCEAWWRRVL